MRLSSLLSLVFYLAVPQYFSSAIPFSQDNAHALLKSLVQEIGPRTMGSPAERRALEWAVAKFKEYGCNRSYLMEFAVADEANTSSGIAVGMLEGTRGRTIVIGAHIDTSAPEVPGANDDGSGVACVLELARVLAQRWTESTILLCCWGGEERGLCGSGYFAEHYPLIDSVALVLQIDMADGAGSLEVDPTAGEDFAPSWLVKATYDVFYDELGFTDLIYPTHSGLLRLGAGGSSDHASFLHKGIPAIAFSSDINYPIHTPEDNIENFTPSGLLRSGSLALKLVERFDGGTPGRWTEQYLLAQVGKTPVFLPYWLLWCMVATSVAVSIAAFAASRSRRVLLEMPSPVKWSGLKLLLFTFLIQACIWYSESLVGVLRGDRFPWVNNFSWYVLLGVLCGLLGVWLSLRWARRLRLTTNQYPFVRAAFVLLLLLVALASVAGPSAAVYPAASLFLFSLSVIVRPPALKLLLILASPFPLLRMVFSESLGLVQRGLSRGMGGAFPASALNDLFFVALFTLLSLPFAFGFAAVYRDAKRDLLWLKRFGRNPIAVGLAVVIVSLTLFLVQRASYDQRWHNVVRVEQRYVLGADSSLITMRGSESLRGVEVNAGGKDSVYDFSNTFHRLSPETNSAVSWCALEGETFLPDSGGERDTLLQVRRVLRLHSQLRPLSVRVTYTSPVPFEVSSGWVYSGGKQSDRKTFSWYSYPSSPLLVPVTFHLRQNQMIAESAEITYDTLAYLLQITRPLTDVIARTVVTSEDTIRASTGSRSVRGGDRFRADGR